MLLGRRWMMRGIERPASLADNLSLVVVPGAVLGLLMWQVASVGHFAILWAKFLQRTGLDPALSGHPNVSLLKGFYQRALGLTNSILVWGSVLALAAIQFPLSGFAYKVQACTAVARELAGFIWAIGQAVPGPTHNVSA